MLIYTLRRLLALIPVGLGVIVLVSTLIHLVPGDPVDAILGSYATAEDKEILKIQLGLNKPIPIQILTYINAIMHGDLGNSLIYNKPVAQMIMARILPTIELALFSLFIALSISLPLGILSALKKGHWIDHVSMTLSLIGVAMPNFWLGPLLILFFSLKLGWLPVSERGDITTYILPSITLGTALAAILSRMTRTSVLENIKEEYVRTARSKGLNEFATIGKHVLRNASIPIVTVVGLQFGVLLTGAVITEKIFDWPGLGTLMLDGLHNRDYPLVQGCILVFACSYLLVNLATDMVYAIIDPRIKLS